MLEKTIARFGDELKPYAERIITALYAVAAFAAMILLALLTR